MSEHDPLEHPKTYERFCRPRFEKVDQEINDLRNCTSELKAVVTDGLKDDVKELKAGQKWLFRLVVGILITVAIGSAGLYWSVASKVATIQTTIDAHEP